MARMLLGDEIDLHSGGEDNIFPHHECEIAQSCCTTGRPTFARIWFHTRHLQVEGEKMSKSKENFFTARDLFARGITPAALRLELIRTHYRTNSNFTMQGLQDCQRMIDRWSRAKSVLVAAASSAAESEGVSRSHGPFSEALSEVLDSLCDDLNVARAVAALNEACRHVNACASSERRKELVSLLAIDSVLGVLGRNASIVPSDPDLAPDLDAAIDSLVAERDAARAARDWDTSDRIRARLQEMGVVVVDQPGGSTWSRRL
jgi:cysteinyl-tRNA synthetase